MADNVKWLKLMNNMFEDEKIEYIESLPDGDMILNVWIKTLCLASKCNDNGNLTITKELPYTTTLLAHKFKKTVTQIEYAFKIMQGLGMVEVNNDILCVSNWCKYQNVDELERLKEQNRLRVAKCRAKKLIEENCKVCAYCGKPATGYDHIIALARGGVDEDYNKVPCCIECNRIKNDKPLADFLNNNKERIDNELVLSNPKLSRFVSYDNVTKHYNVMLQCNDFALNSNSISNNINIVTNGEIDKYFDKIYSIYPRKVSKIQAKETFEHKFRGLEKEEALKKAIGIYRMLEAQNQVWQAENDGQGRKVEFISHFSTWLNSNVENSPQFKKGRKK